MKKFFEEFKTFALKGNVLDLAVAVIIGAAFQSIISSVVNDLINPLLSIILRADFSGLYIPLTRSITVNGLEVPTSSLSLAQLEESGAAVFKYGSFINAVINFVIMAFVVFMLVKGINKLTSLGKKRLEEIKTAPTTKSCPYCCTQIDINAVRCPNCTSELGEKEKSEPMKLLNKLMNSNGKK